MSGEMEITIRWLEITAEDFRDAARMIGAGSDLLEIKWRVLERMGITDREGTPLDAYLKAMHAENGLPYSRPAHPAIADAFTDNGSSRFLWWLA